MVSKISNKGSVVCRNTAHSRNKKTMWLNAKVKRGFGIIRGQRGKENPDDNIGQVKFYKSLPSLLK